MSEYCNLSDINKKLISTAIIDSFMYDAQEVYSENLLQHRNGFNQLRWDFIGTKVINTLKDTNLKVIKVKRGFYSFDIILDEENGTVYNITRKSNLYNVKKERKISHYFWELASINDDIPIQEQQISFFSLGIKEDIKEKAIKELLGNVTSIIKRSCFIIINDDNIEFPSIELYVLDMNLDVVYKEVWKESFEVNYNLEYQIDNEEEEKIALGIKSIITEEKVKIEPRKIEKDEKVK